MREEKEIMSYTPFQTALQEVITAIEATYGDIINAIEEYDTHAIVFQAYDYSFEEGYVQKVDADEFWKIVEKHAEV